MAFTDLELKRLKDIWGEKLSREEWLMGLALISRLEESERLLDEGLKRMELINGPEDNCVIGDIERSCANHSWIQKVQAWLRASGKGGK